MCKELAKYYYWSKKEKRDTEVIDLTQLSNFNHQLRMVFDCRESQRYHYSTVNILRQLECCRT